MLHFIEFFQKSMGVDLPTLRSLFNMRNNSYNTSFLLQKTSLYGRLQVRPQNKLGIQLFDQVRSKSHFHIQIYHYFNNLAQGHVPY